MTSHSPSRAKVLRATALAAGIASLIVVGLILPAEYGIDPLRTGSALGLTALADPPANGGTPAPPAVSGSSLRATGPGELKQDLFEVELRPYEGVEYKYRMEKGAGMVYAWTATAKVNYELHGEPDGAPTRYFDSYDKSENVESHGTFVAPTSGIHGWFWENPTAGRIKIRLMTTGFYGDATEFRDGDRIVHKVTAR